MKCTPASLRVNVAKPDVLVTCELCKTKKSASCFLIDAFKKKRSKDHPKVCSDCNDKRLRPTCTGPCKQRPERPLSYPVKVYICDSCRYPPCDVCKVTQRTKNGKYSFTEMPEWTCKECRLRPKCSGPCGKRPEKPLWHRSAVENYICENCLFPPCDVCKFTQRPKSNCRYRVSVLPAWTCAACTGNDGYGAML